MAATRLSLLSALLVLRTVSLQSTHGALKHHGALQHHGRRSFASTAVSQRQLEARSSPDLFSYEDYTAMPIGQGDARVASDPQTSPSPSSPALSNTAGGNSYASPPAFGAYVTEPPIPTSMIPVRGVILDRDASEPLLNRDASEPLLGYENYATTISQELTPSIANFSLPKEPKALAQRLFRMFGPSPWEPGRVPSESSSQLRRAIAEQPLRDPKELALPNVIGFPTQPVIEHTEANPLATAGEDAVIHFLFMAQDSLPHAHLWRLFFSLARDRIYRTWVHFSKESDLLEDARRELPGLKAVPTVAATWCSDLVTSMVQLLRTALADDSVPIGALQKFVFISDTTLPVKPFHVVYQTLTSSADSDFYFRPVKQWGSVNIGDFEVLLPKHSQWVVLNELHARKMVNAWEKPEGAQKAWDVPLRSELWPSSDIRANISAEQFFECEPHKPCLGCLDEYAFFSKLFGAPVRGKAPEQEYSGLGTIRIDGDAIELPQGRPRTLVYFGWNEWPEGAVEMLKDPELEGFSPVGHPWTFSRLGTISLQALRASPYIFARKFVHNVSMPAYGQVILEHPIG